MIAVHELEEPEDLGGIEVQYLLHQDGQVKAYVFDSDFAQRVSTCVNACARISDEELFGADLWQRLHEQSNKIAQLIKERDELLFQMKYISNQTHLGHIHDTINSCLCRLGGVK